MVLAKTALMVAFIIAAANLRLLDTWADRHDNARPGDDTATGPTPEPQPRRRTPRRHTLERQKMAARVAAHKAAAAPAAGPPG